MLVVVIGPRTRLAQALLRSSSWGSDTSFLLVTRNIEEYDAASIAHPHAALYRAWEAGSLLPDEGEAVAVLCCAFGVIHPVAVTASGDLNKTGVDYLTLETILQKYSSLPLHLVLISSVLALCPRPRREYYAGWKNVVEGLMRQLGGKHRIARLSVFYPGRLIETTKGAGVGALLHTSYRKLAEQIVSVVQHNRCVDTVVGLDARLWLALRSAGLAWSALTGRR